MNSVVESSVKFCRLIWYSVLHTSTDGLLQALSSLSVNVNSVLSLLLHSLDVHSVSAQTAYLLRDA